MVNILSLTNMHEHSWEFKYQVSHIPYNFNTFFCDCGMKKVEREVFDRIEKKVVLQAKRRKEPRKTDEFYTIDEKSYVTALDDISEVINRERENI